MPYYHIRVTSKSSPSKPEVELDLSLDELMDRFVNQYMQGLSIIIAGKIVYADDIERIQISVSEEDSSILNRDLLQRQRRRNVLVPLNLRGMLPSRVLAELGEDVTPRFISDRPGNAQKESDTVRQHATAKSSIKVFISHSSSDVGIAKGLIDLLQKALHLTSDEIRCTSVDGFRMPGGASIDDTLRAEVHNADVLIGLVTPRSLASAYVTFELGARWGAERPMIPLLAYGVTAGDLDEPLGGINALDSSQEGQVHQLVEDLARILAIHPDKTSSYAGAVNDLVRQSIESVKVVGVEGKTATQLQLSEDAGEMLVEATKTKTAIIYRIRTMGGVFIKTGGKGFGEPGNRRSEARWEQAIQELLDQGLVVPLSEKMEAFEVTHKGFRIAHTLQVVQ